ncbi:MAG: LPS export ABC transporter ATP-binding protein [Planctomycetota bacterium]|nr:LPS export ABC transporter ATP-binding protein [Planctomycetota bacterium]MCX8040217.1 LPS export ABC transporter ATP-binding protein [Planctomycetota bacterium]MDW8372488.1 LPS export ABC transporter ATP-binding protein [Planctomycetota bacterium]
MAFFRVDGLTKRFGARTVVQGFCMAVEPGEIVGLLGANGAGKSTTFRMIVGLHRPDAGRVLFRGHDITNWPMHRRARLGIGYLAQEPTVFAALSVADNIRLVLEEHVPRAEHEARLAQLLEELGLTPLREARAAGLSGGERRRLEITRSLVVEPRLMFFDEPFAGVDPKSRAEIVRIIHALRARGVAVLITDHHAETILRLVDRLYIMKDGTNFAAGTPSAMVADPAVRREYLGEDFRW